VLTDRVEVLPELAQLAAEGSFTEPIAGRIPAG
jgi:hypothetical protein